MCEINHGSSAPTACRARLVDSDTNVQAVLTARFELWIGGRKISEGSRLSIISVALTYGLRWELNPSPGEANGDLPYTVSGLDDPATMTLAPKGTPFYATTYANLAPRVGIAYSLFETPGWETVLRGGIGTFYDLGSGNASVAFYAAGFPFSSTKTVNSVPFDLNSDTFTPLPFNSSPPYPRLWVMDPHLSLPRVYQWNTTISQSLGRGQTFTVSYVGAAGRRLLRQEDLVNPNPNFKEVRVTRNAAFSDYHALQIQFERRLYSGLQAMVSYTWAHSTDNASLESSLYSPVATTSPRRDHGPSDFDIRHALSAAATYRLPDPFSHRVLSPLFRLWSLDAILRTNSAQPINVITFQSLNGDTRPDLIFGVPLYIKDGLTPGGKRINRAAFSTPPANQQGTLGRNALRGFPVSQIDLAVAREFTLSEATKFQFRVETFNVLNHPNFAQPVNRLANPNFGRSRSMLNKGLGADAGLNPLYQIGGPRSIQLSAKLYF